jgi:hypothetical protein
MSLRNIVASLATLVVVVACWRVFGWLIGVAWYEVAIVVITFRYCLKLPLPELKTKR